MKNFHPPLLKDNCKTPEKAASKIRNDFIENLYVFRNEIQIQRFKGSENNVNPDHRFFYPRNEDIWVHNHPGGNSFSPDDIQMAVFYNIKKFYLSTPNYLYILERKGSDWGFNPADEDVNKYIVICQERAALMLDKLVSKNEISLLEKEVVFLHYIWVYFFQRYEAIYIQKEF